MLQLIIGTTGSGKTTLLRRNVCDAVNSGQKAIVIVPEQYSFETEKSLYEALGAQKAIGVEVLSFTRLCDKIFREFGGLAGEYIDDSARLLLMSVTLEEIKDILSLYAGKTSRQSFVEALVSQMSEFKNAGISADMLETFAASAEETLAAKTQELAAVFRHYGALIDSSYKDAEDNFKSACAHLECNNFFADYTVFIDSFKSFTAGEHQMLGHILAQSRSVTAALCTNALQDTEHGMGLFSRMQKTADRLKRIAQESGTETIILANLTQNLRTKKDDLQYLEKNIFRIGALPYTKSCENIRILKAQNQYDEVEYVAAAICEAVRSGIRYREIAVVGRDIEGYKQALDSVFDRYNIPRFMDMREDITGRPLTAAILYALEAVRRGFSTEEILALLKTSLMGATPAEIGELENYCYIWSINGDGWLAPFTQSPEGYGKITPADEQRLTRINALREAVITPLMALQGASQQCTGAGFAKAVFSYLGESGIIELLKKADENDEIAIDCELIYDSVIAVLEQFAVALSGTSLKLSQSIELLRLVFASVDIGKIPQTLDQVVVGSADRIRLAEPKITFLVGANEGVFPAVYKNGGLLLNTEREVLIENGIELADTAQSKALEETYCAYIAMCSPSSKLIVCYSCATLKGEALYPSSIVRGLATILPFAPTVFAEAQDELFYIQNKKTAFDSFCKNLRSDRELTASLAQFLSEDGDDAIVKRLLHPQSASEYTLSSPAVIKRLYGTDMSISPSKLEQFYQCRLAYFCRYGLGIKPRRRAELSPLESGSIVHFVLQILLLRHSELSKLTANEHSLRNEIRELLQQYIETNMGGASDKPARFKYLFTRIENTLIKLIQHLAEEFQNSDFRPLYFELPIKKERREAPAPQSTAEEFIDIEAMRVEPQELTFSAGKVYVEGIVDRVDLMRRDGMRYLRVVDYKTGGKKFDLTDVYSGLNLQMLIYLFTLQKNGGAELGGAVPAGVLYMPARTKFSVLDRSATGEEAAAEQNKMMKMNGLLLENTDVITGMEHGAQGVYIPVSMTIKEKTSGRGENKKTELITELKGEVATLAELGRLEAHINRMVTGMAESLHEGNVQAYPTYTKKYDKTCEYCAYRPVCTREEGDAKNEVQAMSRDEVFALLAKDNEQTVAIEAEVGAHGKA